MTGALEGLRVIDLSNGVAGAFCGKLLAGFGADVIKVEPPEGDPLRDAGPFPNDLPNPNASGAYLQMNTAKRSVTLDIETDTGRRLLRDLVERADVLVESYAPGYLDVLGLDYQTLSRDRQELVMVSISAFGQDGPYRDYLGTELVVYAASGYMSLTGDPDREPHKAYGEQTAIHAGYQAALAIAAALVSRDGEGPGQQIDIAQADAAAYLTGAGPHAYILRGEIAERSGTRLVGATPGSPYPSTCRPCKDGWIHAHGNNRYPEFLGDLMGNPRLTDREVLETPRGHADEIDAIMDEWLSNHDRWEVVQLAQEKRLHFTEVMTPVEVLADEAYREREFWFTYQHPDAGEITLPGPFVRATETPWTNGPAPALGEHNAEVYGDLGYSSQDLASLTELRVI
jgi:crotonobetainyl-CoA:carnitine CoA-transferase CaiB-like acyl-CoA transferase